MTLPHLEIILMISVKSHLSSKMRQLYYGKVMENFMPSIVRRLVLCSLVPCVTGSEVLLQKAADPVGSPWVIYRAGR